MLLDSSFVIKPGNKRTTTAIPKRDENCHDDDKENLCFECNEDISQSAAFKSTHHKFDVAVGNKRKRQAMQEVTNNNNNNYNKTTNTRFLGENHSTYSSSSGAPPQKKANIIHSEQATSFTSQPQQHQAAPSMDVVFGSSNDNIPLSPGPTSPTTPLSVPTFNPETPTTPSLLLSPEEIDALDDQLLLENKEFSDRVNVILPALAQNLPYYVSSYRERLKDGFRELARSLGLGELMEYVIVHNTLILLDRFVASWEEISSVKREQLLLLGLTCLWIILKKEGRDQITAQTMSDYYAELTNRVPPSAADFVTVECFILNKVNWELTTIHSFHFFDLFAAQLFSAAEMHDLSITETHRNALCSHGREVIDFVADLVPFQPSLIAASVVSLLRETRLPSSSSWTRALEDVTRYALSDLTTCKQMIKALTTEGQ